MKALKRELPRVAGRRKRLPEYIIWGHLRGRCTNPLDTAYKNYGGRGIKVCARWASFENFLADMGSRPIGLTLERLDNDGDYSPENCVWADRKTQNRNSRNSRLDAEKVAHIRGSFTGKHGDKSILARRFGVSVPTIVSVLQNETWV